MHVLLILNLHDHDVIVVLFNVNISNQSVNLYEHFCQIM